MWLTTGADLKQVFPRDPTSLVLGGDRVALVEMKLRLYRNYSIKLMLAWETCCRSDTLPILTPIPLTPY